MDDFTRTLITIGTDVFGIYCLYKLLQFSYYFIMDRYRNEEF